MESAGDISQELGRRAEAFCRAYFPAGRLAGNYWQVGDTSGAEGGSLNIRLSQSYGRKPGKWTDYVAPWVMLRTFDRALFCRESTASRPHNLNARGVA